MGAATDKSPPELYTQTRALEMGWIQSDKCRQHVREYGTVRIISIIGQSFTVIIVYRLWCCLQLKARTQIEKLRNAQVALFRLLGRVGDLVKRGTDGRKLLSHQKAEVRAR